jgi:hypothetical protein
VAGSHLLHDLHGQLVVIGGDAGRGGWLHHRCVARFSRNCAEQLH